MKNIPTPGSFVEVTTKFRNIHIRDASPFNYVTKKGKVVKPPKWVSADAFCIETGEPNFPLSVININYVDSIKIISGESSNVRKFEVSSKKGKYLVMLNGSHYSCTCIGFKYHSKCKHVTAVKETL